MQLYTPLNNQLISYQFPEIKEILRYGVGEINYYERYTIIDAYRKLCKDWLQSGNHTKITGLDSFPYVYVINGVSQHINDLPKIENRIVVLHEEEYSGYHKILKLYDINTRIVDDYTKMDRGNDNEVIVLSYPTSLNGQQNIIVEDLIKNSKTPVILDGVFLGSNFFNINLDVSNVESFSFSFSKTFGLTYNRIGILFSKKTIDEYELYHTHGYQNLSAIKIAMQVMNEYSLDYFTEKYNDVYVEACKRKGHDTGDCILIGYAKTNDKDKKLLVTDIFDEIINDLQKN